MRSIQVSVSEAESVDNAYQDSPIPPAVLSPIAIRDSDIDLAGMLRNMQRSVEEEEDMSLEEFPPIQDDMDMDNDNDNEPPDSGENDNELPDSGVVRSVPRTNRASDRIREKKMLLSRINEICSNKDMDPGSGRKWKHMPIEALRTIVILLNDNMIDLLHTRSTRSKKECHLLSSLYNYVIGREATNPMTGVQISARQRDLIIAAHTQASQA